MDLLTLADFPTDDTPSSWIQIAKTGSFRDGRYGEFEISDKNFDDWQNAFSTVNRNELVVDADHAIEKGGSSEAAGWVRELRSQDNTLWARVDWTPVGVSAIQEKRYRYISPAFREHTKDEEGNDLGPSLSSVSLTNRPFLKDMAAVSLSEAPVFAEEVVALADGSWDAGAARARLKEWAGGDMKKYGKAFLQVDGDPSNYSSYKYPVYDVVNGSLKLIPAAVRAAAAAAGGARGASPNKAVQSKLASLKKQAGVGDDNNADDSNSKSDNNSDDNSNDSSSGGNSSKKPQSGGNSQAKSGSYAKNGNDGKKSMDSHAGMADLANIAEALKLEPEADESKILEAISGKVMLDADAVTRLEERVRAGEAAAAELHQKKFDDAVSLARREGRLDASEETYELYKGLYEADETRCLTAMAKLPKYINVESQGSGQGATGNAPDGVDQERFELDREIQAIMAEKQVDYASAFDLVLANQAGGH